MLMPRKRKDTTARAEEALSKVVNPTGAGEDPVIQDLLNGEMATASDKDALDMALAMQQILRGQNSLLELVKQNTAEGAEMRAELARMKQEAAERDAAVEKWQNDQQKFLQEVMDRAESLRLKGEALDRKRAEASQLTAEEMKKARINIREDMRKFDEFLAHQPLVTVVAPGDVIMTQVNGQPSMKVLPMVIKIKHRQWVLPPGRRMEVPQIVADALYAKLESQAKNTELQDALSSNMEAYALRDKMRELRKKDEAPYDPSAAPSPIDEENLPSGGTRAV